MENNKRTKRKIKQEIKQEKVLKLCQCKKQIFSPQLTRKQRTHLNF